MEEAFQKKSSKMEDNDKQTIRDDVAILTKGFHSEKNARKRFEQKTEGLIQQKSNSQQYEINKLKNIVNEMNNTIGQQLDKITQLSEENIEMKNTIGQQRDEINQLSEESAEMKNTVGQQRDEINQLSEENIEMKTSLILQQDTIDSLNAIVSDMSSTIEWMKKSIPSTIFRYLKHKSIITCITHFRLCFYFIIQII